MTDVMDTGNALTQTVLAQVIGTLAPGYLQVVLCPGQGSANGGIPREVPLHLVPLSLRTPNTALLSTLQQGRVIAVKATSAP